MCDLRSNYVIKQAVCGRNGINDGRNVAGGASVWRPCHHTAHARMSVVSIYCPHDASVRARIAPERLYDQQESRTRDASVRARIAPVDASIAEGDTCTSAASDTGISTRD
jgi:hypothetical protein